MELYDISSMNSYVYGIISLIVPVITAIAGWFAGKKKRSNDFLKDLQESVNMLADKNKQHLTELIEVRSENAMLLKNQLLMQRELEVLREENEQFKNEIQQLNEKLKDVKTITRKG